MTLISAAYQCYACIYLYTAVRKKVSDKSKKKKSWVHLVPWFGRIKIQRRTKAKTQKGQKKVMRNKVRVLIEAKRVCEIAGGNR